MWSWATSFTSLCLNSIIFVMKTVIVILLRNIMNINGLIYVKYLEKRFAQSVPWISICFYSSKIDQLTGNIHALPLDTSSQIYSAWLPFVKFPHSFPSWFLLQLEWKILVGSNFPFLSNLPSAFKTSHFCNVYIVSQLTAWLYNTWNIIY